MRDSVPGPDFADKDTTWTVLGEAKLARYRRNLANFAKPYTYWDDGEIVYSGYPPSDLWASAGLLSTVRDMAKYDLEVDRHELLKAGDDGRRLDALPRTGANRSPMAWDGTSPTTAAHGSSGISATGVPASPRSTSRCRRGTSR